MTIEITMPRLSETMSDGKILSWNKKVGDRVNKGEIIAEVETDKANMEIEAVDTGTLAEILAGEGSVAKVGDPIAILNGRGPAKPKEAKPAQATQKHQEEAPPKSKVEKTNEIPETKKDEIIQRKPIKREGVSESFFNL